MAGKVKSLLKDAARSGKLIHAGGSVTWSLQHEVIDYLEEYLWPGACTAETGVGASTLLFAFKECHHTVVAPFEDEFQRVCQIAESAGIQTNTLSFLAGMSEDVLPTASLGNLDVALIDGGHGFPVPFVDWLYFAKRLKVGGLVIVDDVQIWTGTVLREFLAAEDGIWSLEKNFGKSVIFKKLNSNLRISPLLD
jgi:hypothetical protein